MAVAHWFLRCTPGISTLLLLIVVEYSLQLGRSTYHYVFHAQYQLEYTPPLIWQLLFAVYSIFLHLIGVLFPIRLARAARRATRSIWSAHMNLRARGSREEKAGETENAYHVMQVVIIPCFKESIETIRDTLNVLASHQHAKASYDIYLAMEERDPKAPSMANQLISEYSRGFMSIHDTHHPAGIPGESAGKSSNVSWAAKEVVRRYGGHPNRKDILVTIMDSDAHLLDQHFQLLCDRHTANRQQESYVLYVPPIIFDRNAHLVPRLVRMADLMWSGAGLSCFKPTPTASDVIIPTAVYTLSLPLVQLAGGWDAGACAIGEDMHMMLKCYFATKGLLRIESLSSPASLCNVSTSKKGIRGLVENHCARYSQGLRHMWGSLDSGYAIGLWLKMRKDIFSSPSSSPTRLPRSRKLSETGPRLDAFDLTTPRWFTWRTMVLFMRLFEAHFLVTHLLLIILASSIFHALPWSSRFECLDWTMHITEGFRFIGFGIMTAYFVLVYDDYHRTCVAVREWESKQAGLYDVSHFSYRSKWSLSSIFDYITFPLAGMLFGSVPLFQAVFSHFWTDNLVYLVSAKPIRILAKQASISANGMDDTKESVSKHSTAV